MHCLIVCDAVSCVFSVCCFAVVLLIAALKVEFVCCLLHVLSLCDDCGHVTEVIEQVLLVAVCCCLLLSDVGTSCSSLKLFPDVVG